MHSLNTVCVSFNFSYKNCYTKNIMKKYFRSAFLVILAFSLSSVSAQMSGDVAPDSSATGCTDLTHNLTYKKSKDANTEGEVSDLQYFLQEEGFLKTEPNGNFGPSTFKAVKAFQAKNGLISSGYVGPVTRLKIKDLSCGEVSSNAAVIKPIVSACTLEARLCPDGSAMPRDTDCTWREGKCPIVKTENSRAGSVLTQVSQLVTQNIVKGDYAVYIGGEKKYEEKSISKDSAMNSCRAHNKSYPSSSIKCIWKNETIFSSGSAVSQSNIVPVSVPITTSSQNAQDATGIPPKAATNFVLPELTSLDYTFGMTSKIAKNICWVNNSPYSIKKLVLKGWVKTSDGASKEFHSQTVIDNPPYTLSKSLCTGVVFTLNGSTIYYTLDTINDFGSVRSTSNEIITDLDLNSTKIVLDLPSNEESGSNGTFVMWKVSNASYCEVYKGSTPTGISLFKGNYDSVFASNGSYQINSPEKGANVYTVSCTNSGTGENVFKTTSVNYSPATPPISYSNGSPAVLGDYAVCFEIPSNIHRGAESSDVRSLQTFLKLKGFLDENPSGFYGDKTVEAVKDYQASKDLPITGMVYDFTRQAIEADSCN